MGCGTSHEQLPVTIRSTATLIPQKPVVPHYDYSFKITIAGDANTGKSSILSRFSDGKFSENFISTVGIDFKIKSIKVGDNVVKLQIWDTAGQERFRTITSNYYRGAHCIVVVFSVNNRVSFENVPRWLREIESYCSECPKIVLIGNKTDMRYEQNSCVSHDEAAHLANHEGIPYFETSAKQNDGVSKVFNEVAKMLIWKKDYIVR